MARAIYFAGNMLYLICIYDSLYSMLVKVELSVRLLSASYSDFTQQITLDSV